MNKNLLNAAVNVITGHEFRTPMNGINGFASLLKLSITNKENLNDQLSYANIIQQSAERLVSLSNRMGIWYSLYSDSNSYSNFFLISVDSISNILLKEADKFLKSGEVINFKSNCQYLKANGKIEYLIHALRELFNNAFKFSEPGSIVSVSIESSVDESFISITNETTVTSIEQLQGYEVFTQFNRDKFEQQGLGIGIEIARLGALHCNGQLILEGIKKGKNSKISFQLHLPF